MKTLLQECIVGSDLNATDFQANFCDYCRNRECSLARWGSDKFSARIQGQAERLFQPDRVSPSEYPKIAHFVDRPDGEGGSLGSWGKSEPTTKGSESPKGPLIIPSTGNVPRTSGGIILGAGPAPASPPLQHQVVNPDPWAAPPNVVKPGARIQMGKKP